MERSLFGGHPNEGVTLWPYEPDIELDAIKRDWFEAYEALITMEPEIAFAPGLRFVITTQPTRLRATAPNRRSTNPSFLLSINCYAVSWDATALVWLRCTRSIRQRPGPSWSASPERDRAVDRAADIRVVVDGRVYRQADDGKLFCA